MNKPAIVVITYDRASSLQRLLSSLVKAHYSQDDVTLIISVDKCQDDSVVQTAKNYEWPHGNKNIIIRESRLGLKNHVLICGDLTKQFGSIIMLEDDLVVSPFFYDYALSTLAFYSNEERLAGFSLFNYQINETANRTFSPLDDGTDVYFMQLASSWGQIWTEIQWQKFRLWHKNSNNKINEKLPPNILRWSDSSWKKIFINYMVSENMYFVFPRISLTTNFGEIGEHALKKSSTTQVPLLMNQRFFIFCALKNSLAVYDAHMEILSDILSRFNKKLASYTFETDLYGKKDLNSLSNEWVLTSKTCTNKLFSFSCEMKPHELNIINDLNGEIFTFCRVDSILKQKDNSSSKYNEMQYDYPYLSFYNTILFALCKVVDKLKLQKSIYMYKIIKFLSKKSV